MQLLAFSLKSMTAEKTAIPKHVLASFDVNHVFLNADLSEDVDYPDPTRSWIGTRL